MDIAYDFDREYTLYAHLPDDDHVSPCTGVLMNGLLIQWRICTQEWYRYNVREYNRGSQLVNLTAAVESCTRF